MKKQIKESSAFSNDPADLSQLVNGAYNISKVDDPVELKRLNNYLTTIFSSSFSSKKEQLNHLRLKLNHLGYDIDLPRNIREVGNTSINVPLKRFGGITGIDDKGQKLDNPYGPGPKMNISITGEDMLMAKVSPAGASEPEAIAPAAPSAPVAPENKEEVKEGFSFANMLRLFRKK